MTRHAADADCPFRFQAIRALGEVRGMGGTAQTLRNLLHADDPRVQVAAYEALLQRGDSTIDSRPVGGDNFMLDLVVTDRPGFIYVKRSGSRRIALFGSHFRCVPPVLYRADDGRVVLNAQAGDDQLTVLRVVVASGAMSPAIPAPFDLPPLIELLGGEADVTPEGEVTGVGLDYTAVVRALHRLCTDRTINARFVLEQPNTAEIFGPPRPAGRRESEL
ncbi:MAG: HEAT repeat domain-containing protein [Phycisphaerae bacterium]